MTTPPPSDDVPDDPRPATEWAPPGSSAPDEHVPSVTGPLPAGSPVWGAPPGGHEPPPAAVPVRTNRLAIAALATGLFGLILLAVGFAIAALVQAGRRGEKGKGLAIGALAASAVWAVAGAVTAVVVLGSLVTVQRDASGNVTDRDKVLPAALRVGDCFTGFQGQVRSLVTALPCAQPHDGEAAASLSLSGDEYPGDEAVAGQAEKVCALKTAHLLLKSRYASDLEAFNLLPSRITWNDGDRRVMCLLLYKGPGALTSPLGQTLDPNLRIWFELAPGDCLGKWDEEAWALRLLSCNKPHWIEVYATFTLKAGPFPGPKATERKAERGCDKQWQKVFRGHPAPDRISWLYPEKEDWETGHRTVVCLGESEGRPMKKSMLPR